MMKYFDQDFIQFFKELSKNNEKEWFYTQKKRYESSVKKPFERFLTDLIAEIHKEDPTLTIEPKNCVLRINRDLRFSKDKSPYNLHYSAVVSKTGRKDKSVPGIFLRFSPEEVGIMGGAYVLDKHQLQAARLLILNTPDKFQQLVSAPAFHAKFGELNGEESKRMPAEFLEHVDKIPQLLKKQFYVVAKHNADLILSSDLLPIVMEHWHAVRPLNQFFSPVITY